MYCFNCGKKLKDNSLFCPYCGTKLNNKPESPAPVNLSKNAAESEETTSVPVQPLPNPTPSSTVQSQQNETPTAPSQPIQTPPVSTQPPQYQLSPQHEYQAQPTPDADKTPLYRQIICQNTAYYLPKFQNMRSGAKSQMNWASLLGGILHAGYRNMWREWLNAIKIPLIGCIATGFIAVFFLESLNVFFLFLALAAGCSIWLLIAKILFSKNFNQYYMEHVEDKIYHDDLSSDTSISRAVIAYIISAIFNAGLTVIGLFSFGLTLNNGNDGIEMFNPAFHNESLDYSTDDLYYPTDDPFDQNNTMVEQPEYIPATEDYEPTIEEETESWYRVRKTWADESSQKGAFQSLENAKKCADENPGYFVFDEFGKAVYTKEATVDNFNDRKYQVYYSARVISPDGIGVNLRSGPDSSYSKVRENPIPVGAIVTITEEVTSIKGSLWGYTQYEDSEGWVYLAELEQIPKNAGAAANVLSDVTEDVRASGQISAMEERIDQENAFAYGMGQNEIFTRENWRDYERTLLATLADRTNYNMRSIGAYVGKQEETYVDMYDVTRSDFEPWMSYYYGANATTPPEDGLYRDGIYRTIKSQVFEGDIITIKQVFSIGDGKYYVEFYKIFSIESIDHGSGYAVLHWAGDHYQVYELGWDTPEISNERLAYHLGR